MDGHMDRLQALLDRSSLDTNGMHGFFFQYYALQIVQIDSVSRKQSTVDVLLSLFNQLFTFVSLDTKNENKADEHPNEQDMPQAQGKSNKKLYLLTIQFLSSLQSQCIVLFL